MNQNPLSLFFFFFFFLRMGRERDAASTCVRNSSFDTLSVCGNDFTNIGQIGIGHAEGLNPNHTDGTLASFSSASVGHDGRGHDGGAGVGIGHAERLHADHARWTVTGGPNAFVHRRHRHRAFNSWCASFDSDVAATDDDLFGAASSLLSRRPARHHLTSAAGFDHGLDAAAAADDLLRRRVFDASTSASHDDLFGGAASASNNDLFRSTGHDLSSAGTTDGDGILSLFDVRLFGR